MNNSRKYILYIVFLVVSGCSFSKITTQNQENNSQKYLNLYKPLPAPKLGDWLRQNQEKGQTFEQYKTQKITFLTEKRTKIYLLPIGQQAKLDSQLVKITAEYLAIFFGQKVEIQTALTELKDTIPDTSKRVHHNHNQLHTKFVLYHILKSNLPADACAYMALSSVDLFPASRWGFVFGEASLSSRVGVSSSFRHKNGIENNLSDEEKFNKTLIRVLKTTTHELGHVFSMRHCISYQCLMNGSNNQQEMDNSPFYLCPVCSQKLDYTCKTNTKKRYKNLYKFFKKYNFKQEYKFCRKVLKHIK